MAQATLTVGQLNASRTMQDAAVQQALQDYVKHRMPVDLQNNTTNEQKLQWVLEQMLRWLQQEARQAHVQLARRAAERVAQEEADTGIDLEV